MNKLDVTTPRRRKNLPSDTVLVSVPPAMSARFLARVRARLHSWRPRVEGPRLTSLVRRLDVQTTPRGVVGLRLRSPGKRGRVSGGRHAVRALAELREFLEGRRTFFTVPVDLSGLGAFQRRVLSSASRVPFGEVVSYAALAASVGRPRAARAVGNALAANPVPIIVPCHRIVRSDGTWGHYGLGPALKTRLLGFERAKVGRSRQ
jgi:methylated-DNA-[protein]-cysteine S-methyltransferase